MRENIVMKGQNNVDVITNSFKHYNCLFVVVAAPAAPAAIILFCLDFCLQTQSFIITQDDLELTT